MKLIYDGLPMEGEEEDGRIQFSFENFFYDIGSFDGSLWISRQTLEDYENGKDNWERIERWVPENKKDFNFFRGEHFPNEE